MSLSFTTTAMARPEIIERTYGSFKENLIGIDWSNTTLFINIEPLPNSDAVNSVIEVARETFGNVEFRTPEEPNFTRAVSWCWKNADTDFIFHLEDDWVLVKKIHINELIKPFESHKVNQVPLRAYSYEYDKMCLSPSVIRSSWAQRFVFDYKLNPEVQLRKPWVKPNHIYVPHKEVVVKDIGRSWIKSTDYQKPSHKASFTSWEKK